MKNNNISCDKFTDIAKNWAGENRQKLYELADIYCRYQGHLAASGLADVNDFNWRVKDFVADQRNEVALLKGISHLVIEDIYDFTLVQFELIVALACRIEHTTVIIPYDHDREDIFGPVERTIRRFERLWELNRDINLDFKPQYGGGHGVLSLITKQYLKKDDRPTCDYVGNNDEVVVIESAGIYREAETIGREIRKLLDSGISPHSIGVLFKDLSLYGELMEDVFRRFRIPLYFRRGNPLLSNSVIKTVLSIFEILDSNFVKRRIFFRKLFNLLVKNRNCFNSITH